MKNTNKLVGALLMSILTTGLTLPAQYTAIENFSLDNKKALGIGVLTGLAIYGTYKYLKNNNVTDKSGEEASGMQQARDSIVAGLNCITKTAQTHPKTTVAALMGAATLVDGVYAYYIYDPNNSNNLTKLYYEAVKATGDNLANKSGDLIKALWNQAYPLVQTTSALIKSDLTIDSTNVQNNFFSNLLKASRMAGLCFACNICITNLGPPSRPDARQYDIKHDPLHTLPPGCGWALLVIIGPICEELLFTGGGSLLFKDYAQIVVPPLFAGTHLVGEHSQDGPMKFRVFLSTAIMSFIHHRMVRQNLRSELPVVIMSHILHNQLSLAFSALLKART